MTAQAVQRHHAERDQTAAGRFYRTPCGRFPSVTTILSATKPAEDREGIARWQAKVGKAEADRILADACERGTKLHKAVEDHLADPFAEVPADVAPWWASIEHVIQRLGTPTLIEGALWHPAGYAGTADCVACPLDAILSLLDWKTARKPKRPEWIADYFLQVAAYAAAFGHVYGLGIDNAAVVVAYEDRPADVFPLDGAALASWHARFLVRLGQFQAAHVLHRDRCPTCKGAVLLPDGGQPKLLDPRPIGMKVADAGPVRATNAYGEPMVGVKAPGGWPAFVDHACAKAA